MDFHKINITFLWLRVGYDTVIRGYALQFCTDQFNISFRKLLYTLSPCQFPKTWVRQNNLVRLRYTVCEFIVLLPWCHHCFLSCGVRTLSCECNGRYARGKERYITTSSRGSKRQLIFLISMQVVKIYSDISFFVSITNDANPPAKYN